MYMISLNKRTVMAAWFLGLFLFIYTEKLLHTHKEADHINKTESHVSSCNTCALCDLQPEIGRAHV